MANQKQSDLFWGGGAGAIAVPTVEGSSQFVAITANNGNFTGVQTKYQEFTVTKSGKYNIGFDATVSNTNSQTSETRFVQITIRKNGTSLNADSTQQVFNSANAGADYATLSGNAEDDLIAGDTIEIWVSAQNSGAFTMSSGNFYIVPVGQGDQLVGNAVEATSSAIGLVKKNKVQTKVLAANVTATQADMAIGGNTDFEFNGIINGQLYKIDLSVRILHSGSANVESIDVKAQYDGEIVRSYSRNDGGSTYVSASGFIGQQTSDSVYFIGTATTRLHFSSSVTGTGTIFSSATKATLTEVADSELTTDFT